MNGGFSERFLAGLPSAAPFAPPAPRPVQVLYGGAHLWKRHTLVRAGEIALETLHQATPDDASFAEVFGIAPDLATRVRTRVERKLTVQPVEDYRIDFEDGYGLRDDAEEDEAARSAALLLAELAPAGGLPPFVGIRVKSLSEATRVRSFRTLDVFFHALGEARSQSAPGSVLPPGLVVTLPKVESAGEVAVLCRALTAHEARLGVPARSIGMELMVETPRALVADDGTFALRRLVLAAEGRCVAAHFGAYDYTASLGIAAGDQSLDHPACVLARSMMKLSLSGLPVGLSDGATTELPLPTHRGASLSEEQRAENLAHVRRALAAHGSNVQRALREGLTQGWDLHPSQLVARYAALFAYYARSEKKAVQRLVGFLDRAARATSLGSAFDDAATALGLVQHFVDGVRTGALDGAHVEAELGVPLEVLATRSFAQILGARTTTLTVSV